jgi:hypothetical protein|tara:strand:- start:2736 stop:3182 length:447 start_codon:yes stop_codon:yes gene_type:complete
MPIIQKNPMEKEKIKDIPQKNKQIEDEKPDYQEKITFLVSTVAQAFILTWCLLVLSLGYIKLPSRLFGIDIPDQPRVDSTFAAGLLGNILGGLGISVNAAQGAKKKKKEEENGNIGNSSNGTQTIIIKQPLEIVTTKPDVIKVDPTKK